MTNFNKIKARNKLGTPPSAERAQNNLSAPETAPEEGNYQKSNDGRSERATGRTEPFATRVRPGVRQKYKQIAARDEMTMGALLEEALEAYEKAQEN